MVKQQNSWAPPPQRRFASYAYGLESYLKDPEKRRAQNRESYMKDLEKVVLTAQHEAVKVNKKDLEKSCWNKTGLAISYKSKKTAAA